MANAKKIPTIQDEGPAASEFDDLTLAFRAKHGDEDALVKLWSRHKNNVTSQIRRLLCKHENDVGDLENEVWIKLQKGIRKFRGDSKFSVWLFRIVRNECVKFLVPTQRIQSRTEPLENYIQVEQDRRDRWVAHLATIQEAAHEFLNRWESPEERKIVQLSVFEGLLRADVVAMSGKSSEQVKYICKKFLTQLRESLKAQPGVSVMKSAKAKKV